MKKLNEIRIRQEHLKRYPFLRTKDLDGERANDIIDFLLCAVGQLVKQVVLASDETIHDFALSNGGREVHRSWVNNMQAQGRRVAYTKQIWECLSNQDKKLDQCIAYDVIRDFIVWIQGHAIFDPDIRELVEASNEKATVQDPGP